MIKDFSPRLYQQTILGTAAAKNTLVVLPTGLGKTALAFLLAAQRLHHYPKFKILMLAPTKPLCEQHLESFRKHLDISSEKVVLFTGGVKPEKRAEMWKQAQIIISTPQGLENDVINNRITLGDCSLLCFDEAHHATGDYSYVWLAQQYDKTARFPRILALTASPGSDLEKIKEICQNLKIERVEVRTEKDPDVKQYLQNIKINWIKVDFPQEFKAIQKFLRDSLTSKLLEMNKLGSGTRVDLTKGELLQLQLELQKKVTSGERDFETLRSLSLIAEAMKIDHSLELLESQGIAPLQAYFHKLQSEAATSKVKAVQNLMLDVNIKSAMYLIDELAEQKIQHPKMGILKGLVQEQLSQNKTAKIIIFTQFRDTAEEVTKNLSSLNITNHIFVGQAKKKGIGFSQKQQKEILDKFRCGEFNVLVATSVAEEGLDIPRVDKVIFYEPIPSAIRSIQRRGRTGRLEEGEVTILMTSGTRDEGYRWSAHHKEKRMYRHLEDLKQQLSFLNQENQKSIPLQQFISDQQVITVLADNREKDNKIVKELIELGVSVKTAQLHSADYVISGKVGIELKKIPDFVASIIDGRLLDQMRDLKHNFEKAILVIEGEEDFYSIRNIHPNAIRGMLAAIVLDFHVPILYTKNPKDTAALLAVMAKREQDSTRDFSYHERKPRTVQEQLEFILSAFPGIGVVHARHLLHNFGTLKNLFAASKEELITVEGIGEKTAEKLLALFEQEYGKKQS